MEFGIAMATDADSWKLVAAGRGARLPHRLVLRHPDAERRLLRRHGRRGGEDRRIRLGTGVLIPSNRIAAVTANAFATLNKLAPGRIDIGVGTGFTGRRAMGLGAMKLTEFEEYIRVIMALLREETVETEIEGKRRKIRLLNPDLGLIDTRDPIGLHVSASARERRRADRAARRRLDQLLLRRAGRASPCLVEMQQAWDRRRPRRGRPVGHRLRPGLRAGGRASRWTARAPCAQAGPRAAVLLHRAADETLSGLPNISPVPAAVAGRGRRLCRGRPAASSRRTPAT